MSSFPEIALKIKRNICSTPPQLIGVYWCKQYVSVWFPLIFLENNPFNVAAAASWLWFCHVLDGPRWISERLWCHSIIHAVLWCAKRHGKRRQGGPGSLQKREGLAAQVGCLGCVIWDMLGSNGINSFRFDSWSKKTVNRMRTVQHPFTFDDIWCWYHAWCLHTCQSIFYQRKFSSKTSKLRTNVQGHFCRHVHHIVSESSSRVGAVEKSNSSGTRDFTGESHSFIYSFFFSFIHSVFHSLMHACVHAFIHPSYHFISSHIISFHFIFLSLQALLHSCPTHKQFL